MRLFFDSNVLTYIAIFEGYLSEGVGELPSDCVLWERLQGAAPEEARLREVHALRALYLLDDQAHFDWLLSNIALVEIEAIRDQIKRQSHASLLDRLIEHRADVYEEEGHDALDAEREARFLEWRHLLPERMWNDARQFAEAEIVEAYFFVTTDTRFIARSEQLQARVTAILPSDLPFLHRERI